MVPTDEPPQGSSENTLDASVPAAPDRNPQVPHDSEPDADGDQVDGGSLIISAILLGISLVMASIILTTGMDRSGSLIAASIRQTELALGAAHHERDEATRPPRWQRSCDHAPSKRLSRRSSRPSTIRATPR